MKVLWLQYSSFSVLVLLSHSFPLLWHGSSMNYNPFVILCSAVEHLILLWPWCCLCSFLLFCVCLFCSLLSLCPSLSPAVQGFLTFDIHIFTEISQTFLMVLVLGSPNLFPQTPSVLRGSHSILLPPSRSCHVHII